MSTKNVIGLVWANVMDLFVSLRFEGSKYLPTHNQGRDDDKSWGSPHNTFGPAFEEGYDPSKGTLVAYPLDAFKQEAKEGKYPVQLAKGETPAKYAKRQYDAFLAFLDENKSKVCQFALPDDDAGKPQSLKITWGEVADFVREYLPFTPPKFWVVCGQRRTSSLMFTMAYLAKRGKLDLTKPVADQLQLLVDVREYKDHETTSTVQLEENDDSTRRGYSDVGVLRNAIRMLTIDPFLNETTLGNKIGLRDLYGNEGKVEVNLRGARQKAYRWARLATMHPELKIGERIGMAPTYEGEGEETRLVYQEGGYIPVKKLCKETAQGLLGQAKVSSVKQPVLAVLPEGTSYVQGTPLPAESVEAAIRNVMEGSSGSSTGLKASDLKTVEQDKRSQQTVVNLHECLVAIRTGNLQFMRDALSAAVPKPVETP